jgi:hypothetical protein
MQRRAGTIGNPSSAGPDNDIPAFRPLIEVHLHRIMTGVVSLFNPAASTGTGISAPLERLIFLKAIRYHHSDFLVLRA